jgi:uncharacterized membrane protein
MKNIPQETQDAFQKENDMSIEEAIKHVEEWINESNFDSAEAGINEIKKLVPDIPEVITLEKQLRSMKSKNIQKDVKKASNIKLQNSNLEDVTESEKFLSAIGYFGFFAVLPLALKPESEFCSYHGKQSLLLALLFAVISAISVILPGGFGLISLLHLGITVYGGIQAHKGKLWNMPVIGDLSRKLPI